MMGVSAPLDTSGDMRSTTLMRSSAGCESTANDDELHPNGRYLLIYGHFYLLTEARIAKKTAAASSTER
eukprot:1085106-Pyramimonas_sp.AAC.1